VRLDAHGSATTVERRDGSHDRLRQTLSGFHIARVARGETRQIALGGFVGLRRPALHVEAEPMLWAELTAGRPLVFELGANEYRRSEEEWEDADRPAARVALALAPNELAIEIAVKKTGELTFVPRDSINRYDNEPPDINGDGVQLYVADERGASAWVLVPETGHSTDVRARPIEGWATTRDIRAEWRRTTDGYSMRVRVDISAGAERHGLGLGVVVNEKPAGRERRRGQLVLGGSPGEFIYLRGDREDIDRLPRFRIMT
jgi:hypothetical protein